MHIQLLSSTIELIVNQAISIGHASEQSLAKLEHKSLVLQLAEIDTSFCMSVDGDHILVTNPEHIDDSFDCLIKTSISTLIQLKNEQQLTQLIKEDKLDIIGDIKVAQQYASLFESLDIDWRSELEKHLGDIATYKLLHLAKQVGNKVSFARKQVTADATEWLVHEKKWLVTQLETLWFEDQVSELGQQMQSLASRFDALYSKVEQLHQSKATTK